MKDTGNLHLKIQELCDCYSTTDPLKEMSEIQNEDPGVDAALKWVALAALHGVNNNAKKITIKQTTDGTVAVTAEYRDSELPSPGSDVASNIFEAVREVTHIEGNKGKTTLALGMRDSSLDLEVKVKEKDDGKKISIKFP